MRNIEELSVTQKINDLSEREMSDKAKEITRAILPLIYGHNFDDIEKSIWFIKMNLKDDLKFI